LTIIIVNLVAKFYAVAKISQIYCWGILIWATLYVSMYVLTMCTASQSSISGSKEIVMVMHCGSNNDF